ncbi:HTH-type transcriptional regulator YidZ [Vibrio parahaemolyticus]|uniref:HTH-type transcriptional regulator YidZ n=1 Tax=Vibrio parahaemolyticus TaxID=670 RepID=UPI001123F1BC|nr:HTH-type transcriptional regulator YidZ [Vibrio parahaemolyticus]ELA9309424.1 HTH-type transcriptional regulator YidZ [Vibrio parahaemolyticus]MBE4113259.1 HTH-type transcriptional regulator YidZ [Vibrio parahaemolyticus]MDF4515655.1 HTH-type transcriptional regulator YidZ [Vibrio parahaemolyticus]MDF4519513.1 HTH-type transcriptional regulator YidZ [Vibrio parahaemolyticus]MDF4536703.1 HTH-type transcriptional regulator YidZ [Vibrio parahaemolyticus]
MKKSLARLDLNLLLTLQLLLQEQSVTKAAKKLNVTPSTVSKSLGKLRAWFDDPLFVNTPQGLKPTNLATNVQVLLSDWMQIGNQIVSHRGDDAPSGVKFHLGVESPLSLIMADELTKRIHDFYPDSTVKFHNWDYDSLDAITSGEVDIGFTGRESHPRSKESLELLPYFINFEVLFSDLPMVYVRKDHPALKQDWNLDTFLSYAHINVAWEKNDSWALDEILAEQGHTRNVSLTMASFEQALFVAEKPAHQMLTTAPKYCQRYCEQLHPNLVALPIPIAEDYQHKLLIPFTMIWHKRNNQNPKIMWLRKTIKSLYGTS